ncbi:hypothetical protein ACTG16_23520 [Aeromonas sp. 23P]|uniref:hypothetical protein n=1 Tax=Aeromonas sp. 23P TaxID=3452716 RepID=UPI003F793BED
MKRLIVINDDTLCRTELDSDFRFSSRDVLPQLLITLAVKDSSSHRVGHPIAAEDVRTARLATMEDLLDFRALKGNTRAMKQQERETYLSPDKLHELAVSLSAEYVHQIGLLNWHFECFGKHEEEICDRQDAYHSAGQAFSETLKKVQDSHDVPFRGQGGELMKAICRGVEALALQPPHAGMTPIPPLVEEQRSLLRDEGDNIQRSLFIAVEHYYRLRARHQCLLDIWNLNHRTEVLKKSGQSAYTQLQRIEYDHKLVRTMLANKGRDIESILTDEDRLMVQSSVDEYFDCIREMESVFGPLVSGDLNERDKFIAQNGRFRH